ncbi:MAG: hypothetical protein HC873_22660 [Leptolyngbyaceae cyanobacterium SL_1_1]|nr:hypothetical protein [Leptolyngbyaceae cyanobacterium SL_1_1]
MIAAYPKGVWGQPAAISSTQSLATKQENPPLCYLQTNEGRIVDLSQFCGTEGDLNERINSASFQQSQPALGSSQPSLPSQGTAALPSEAAGTSSSTPCFVFDAQGRRCG